ncbi:MAG: cyclic nucleotide-binding domain-containing protein, partial [Kiritimatiellia bacterium]
ILSPVNSDFRSIFTDNYQFLGIQSLENIAGSKAVMRQRLDRLRTCDIFKGLNAEELIIISEYAAEVTVDAGENFIFQDEMGDCFFMIVEGDALVYRNGDYEEEVPLFVLSAEESIGEMGYFSDARRLASARALSKTQLLKIRYADLEAVFKAVPSMSRNFLHLITQRLKQTNYQLERSIVKRRRTELSLESIYKMLDMTEILTLRSGIEGQIKRIITTAGKIMEAERATLFLVDRVSGELWSMVAEGLESREIRIPMGQGIAGWVAAHNETLNIEDAYADHSPAFLISTIPRRRRSSSTTTTGSRSSPTSISCARSASISGSTT